MFLDPHDPRMPATTGGSRKSNLRVLPNGEAWSYRTCLIQNLPDGRRIGNATRYSATTSRHQNAVGVKDCDIVLTAVPFNADDLRKYLPVE